MKKNISKIIFIIAIIIIVLFSVYYLLNRDKYKDIKVITSENVDTYDKDLYIYDFAEDTIFVSKTYYSDNYLGKNSVDFDKYKVDENTKYYYEKLSNTKDNLDDIKVTYDKVSNYEFNRYIKTHKKLKVYIWYGYDDVVDHIVLYSVDDNPLEMIEE